MQIEFSPQRNDNHASYSFDGDIVSVTMYGNVEVYDFTGLPDGEITEIDQGALSQQCVLRAKKVAGSLTVVLLLTHPNDAPEEVRFPNNPYDEEGAAALLAVRDSYLITDEPPFVEEPANG